MASQNLKASDLGLVYGEGTEKLSQLSDIVSLSQDNDLSSQPPPIVAPLCCSQPGIAELQEQLPSQPLLPTPELPIGSQRIDNSGAREPDRPLSRFRRGATTAEEHALCASQHGKHAGIRPSRVQEEENHSTRVRPAAQDWPCALHTPFHRYSKSNGLPQADGRDAPARKVSTLNVVVVVTAS